MNKPETYSSGITIEQDTPMRALSQPRKQLFAGYNFSRVVMEDGEIWVWGANNVG